MLLVLRLRDTGRPERRALPAGRLLGEGADDQGLSVRRDREAVGVAHVYDGAHDAVVRRIDDLNLARFAERDVDLRGRRRDRADRGERRPKEHRA